MATPILRTDRRSPNHDGRGGVPVTILVLHYTGMPDAAGALDRLCDPAAKVSAHYLVDEDGTIWALVDEARRAWHGGHGQWAGIDQVNAASIGIELVNPGHEWGYRPFPEAQMRALEGLASGILARHAISPHNVIGHSDMAPGRKQDPGELFDWPRLAAAGIGLWAEGRAPVRGGRLGPGETGTLVAELQDGLARFGFGLAVSGRYDDETRAVVAAFQRHFRPAAVDGVADLETRGRLARLLQALDETPKS